MHNFLTKFPSWMKIFCADLVPIPLIVAATVGLIPVLILVRDLVAARHGGGEGHPGHHPQTTLDHNPDPGQDLVPVLHADAGGHVPDLDPLSCLQFVHRGTVLLPHCYLHSCKYACQLHYIVMYI